MNEYLLLKFLHLLGFVYWLGGDLGTYVASRAAVRPGVDGLSQRTAISIMLTCDLGPRLAMPLMFAAGIHLAALGGALNAPDWVPATAWTIGIAWLASAAYLALNHTPSAFGQHLATADLLFRVVISLALIIWGLKSLAIAGLITADWLALKLVLFGWTIAAGIAVRIVLKDFGPALMRLHQDAQDTQAIDTLRRSILACRPWVWSIWVALFINAALGLHVIP